MVRRLIAVFFFLFAGLPALAQTAWLQIEAQRTLTGAQDAARGYAAAGVENVNGFLLGSGWYGIAVGPFGSEADAAASLRDLRRRGLIPGDSYVVDGGQYRQQYWPAGVTNALTTAPVETPDTTETPVDPEVVIAPEPDPIQTPDETLREARDSESLLSREEKMDLQVALQWAGVYSGAIDGLYGRGTRNSMAAWQEANNHDPTGVLTTGQRAELFAAYNAILDGMDLRLVRDDAAGIEMQIPTGVVAFSEYEPPFARYDAKGDIAAQVLLI